MRVMVTQSSTAHMVVTTTITSTLTSSAPRSGCRSMSDVNQHSVSVTTLPAAGRHSIKIAS
jgi:outer membrane murein-binding lipoprotein Lpp